MGMGVWSASLPTAGSSQPNRAGYPQVRRVEPPRPGQQPHVGIGQDALVEASRSVSGDALTLAVAQIEICDPQTTSADIAAAGGRVRAAIAEAGSAGARVVQFPEGTLAYPGKRVISRSAPELDEADWDRIDWSLLRTELEATAACAAQESIWVVIGAPHRLSEGHRPHNRRSVVSDTGELLTRYDKRRLSAGEITYLYTPGTEATVVEVDGYRLGFALCLEILFPELFVDYAAADVDAVLVSSAADPKFAALAQSHALMNMISVGLAFPADPGERVRSGVCDWTGWLARCEAGRPGVAIGAIRPTGGPGFVRQARNGLYDGHYATADPRSLDRRSL